MKKELQHVQKDKEELSALRLDIAMNNKSPPWDMEDLDNVLKNLKNNKSRDPLGNANEIFKPKVVGDDLKLAILLLVNRIKDNLKLPEVFKLCDVTSIFKKGRRSEFTNYRGIFRVIIFRSILDRLVYNDIYPEVDSNLSDANVGSRKGRNVRDNLFVLYATMNSIKSGGEEACDIAVYDVIKCFDSLWAQECINDLWDAGCRDDKLKILALGNESARVAVRTPGGMTDRETISNIIMQGTVNAGLNCTSTMDKLAKSVYEDKRLVYMYKGVAEVPPLEMVDDVLTVSKCSITSLTMNILVNSFMDNKKLKLSKEKCSVIHVGRSVNKCHKLKVHGSSMQQTDCTKYLGDMIHKSTKVTANLAARLVKAVASFSVIRAILEDIPLGTYRTQVGLELRRALFVNSVLFNCETWHSLKDSDLKDLNLIDHQLLRYICSAQAKTPLEFLFLETGSFSLSHIISSRRMNYFFEIITRADSELIKRVYKAQKENPSPGDFINLVKSDFEFINVSFSEERFGQMSKPEFRLLIRNKLTEAALSEFTSLQAQHSKVRDIPYPAFSLQNYLKCPDFSKTDCDLLMALRSHSVKGIKANFSSINKEDMSCPLKCESPCPQDNQIHLMSCPAIVSKLDRDQIERSKHIKYPDIYGDIPGQKAAVRHLSILLDIRRTLLEELQTTASTSGPSLDTAPPASQGSSGS